MRSNALDGELKTLKTRYEEVETENKRLSARLTETEEELNKIKGDLEDAEAKVPVMHVHIYIRHITSLKIWIHNLVI